ncbi:amylo-alpha-1,6-glucosidase [Brassicibacter mesophilus]|uniref:amylo-alpha-1,6-glucosidase n=1 Tax=Brassicibacter mesophilus TaxID=745119 RepID=UPI003D214645
MLDITKIPFSRYGSFITISPIWGDDKNELYIRIIRGGDMNEEYGKIFKIQTINENGEVIPYSVNMTEVELILEADEGKICFCIENKSELRVYGENIGLRLSMETHSYDNVMNLNKNRCRVNNFTYDIKFMITSFEGHLRVDAPWDTSHSKYAIIELFPENKSSSFNGVIEEFKTVWKQKEYTKSYLEVLEDIKREYREWNEKTLKLPEKYREGKKIASYITWSCVVPSEGRLTRPAMYMSKNWMTNIWSWDHCFNAMALVHKNPELAWDQLMIFFDIQDESGVLPDFVNDKFEYFSCTKPPIHGWAIDYMIEYRPDFFDKEKLKQLYEPLSKWTEYWFRYTTIDDSSIPSYSHGNDAGWDNSTIFSKGVPLKSPDLLSFLILQMKTLGNIANKLKDKKLQIYWEDRVEESLKRLLDYFWTGKKFVPRKDNIMEDEFDGDSLIMFIPIILGNMLPKNIIDNLVDGLKEEGRFLTKHGLATESLRSKYYKEDGYWRGPIWAPATMLIVDGLCRVGEYDFAKDISKRFVEMANSSGMAENFNAETGEGLRDKAFTWTSSVFLILGNKLLDMQ